MLRLVSTIAVLVGCSVIAGWAFNLEILKRFLPGLVAMHPTTALAFILAGVSLLLLLRDRDTNPMLRRVA